MISMRIVTTQVLVIRNGAKGFPSRLQRQAVRPLQRDTIHQVAHRRINFYNQFIQTLNQSPRYTWGLFSLLKR